MLALLAIQAGAAAAPQAPTLESMIERVRSDLVSRRSAPIAAIRTLSADAVVWQDMSMGCGKRNESYAQVEVEGFHIVLEYGGERFDYRARSDGHFILCSPELSVPRARSLARLQPRIRGCSLRRDDTIVLPFV